jgi:GH15 family glucan-1,4-alpha-glucosidase
MSYKPIENYGIIGDLRTVAQVGMDGSIDFMSFPDFDSPTIFAALLDESKGGRFQLAPVLADANQKQLYLPDSNILLTRFLSDAGVAEISDFMPAEQEGTHELVRRAKTVRGEIHFRMVCQPRFDYARSKHLPTWLARACARPLEVRVRTPGMNRSAAMSVVRPVVRGETCTTVLSRCSRAFWRSRALER